MVKISTFTKSKKIFFSVEIKKDPQFEIHFIRLEKFSQEFTQYISEHFVSICQGKDSESSLVTVKKRVKERTRAPALAQS